jgi:hypothetical protein
MRFKFDDDVRLHIKLIEVFQIPVLNKPWRLFKSFKFTNAIDQIVITDSNNCHTTRNNVVGVCCIKMMYKG